MALRTIFFGTPEFAATVLRGLVDSPHEILAAVAAPDRPSGRGRKVRPGAVSRLARELGLPLIQPRTLRDTETQARLREFNADVFAVAACGFILPEAVLSMPRLAAVNAHASILPALRGAAPIERAIMLGLEETGVTIQRMVGEVDAGDVYGIRRTSIGPRETADSLKERLAEIAAELMPEVLTKIETGETAATPQDASQVTRAPPLTRDDRAIRWSESAVVIDGRVRAFSPKPGAFAIQPEELGGKLIKIIEAEPEAEKRDSPSFFQAAAEPGEVVVASDRDGLVVATGEGLLKLVTVQPEGKRPMAAAAYLRGHRLRAGMKLLDGATCKTG